MADMHFDTAVRLAAELYKGGMDLTDIWIVGQNMQVATTDEFWTNEILEKAKGGANNANEANDEGNTKAV